MTHEDRYYARSWALLTHDSGWTKPLLVMSAALTAGISLLCVIMMLAASVAIPLGTESAMVVLVLLFPLSLIPSFLVGLGINGYALEWARLTAWEVDAAPKQRGVRLGDCVKSGWRAFVATLGYIVAFSLLQGVIQGLFLRSFLSGLVGLVLAVASVFMSVVYVVVSLRATIYQRVGAGYKLNRVWDMVSADPVGLLKIAGIALLIGIVGGIGIGIVGAVTIVPTIAPVAFAAARGANGLTALTGAFGSLMAWVVIIGFFGSVLSVFETLIVHTAVALWMRQFHVPLWGASDDPLPNPDAIPPVGGSHQHAGATVAESASFDAAIVRDANRAGSSSDGSGFAQAPVPSPAPAPQDAWSGAVTPQSLTGDPDQQEQASPWPSAPSAPVSPLEPNASVAPETQVGAQALARPHAVVAQEDAAADVEPSVLADYTGSQVPVEPDAAQAFGYPGTTGVESGFSPSVVDSSPQPVDEGQANGEAPFASDADMQVGNAATDGPVTMFDYVAIPEAADSVQPSTQSAASAAVEYPAAWEGAATGYEEADPTSYVYPTDVYPADMPSDDATPYGGGFDASNEDGRA